jgi:hypothetical protein
MGQLCALPIASPAAVNNSSTNGSVSNDNHSGLVAANPTDHDLSTTGVAIEFSENVNNNVNTGDHPDEGAEVVDYKAITSGSRPVSTMRPISSKSDSSPTEGEENAGSQPAMDYSELTMQNVMLVNNYAVHMELIKDDHENAEEALVKLVLVPHVHTLFCERKQRVCSSVGKIQELEYVKIEPSSGLNVGNTKWLRSTSPQSNSYIVIAGSDGLMEYQLQLQDVGCFISVQFTVGVTEQPNNDDLHVTHVLGPVLPGPPRLTKVSIEGKLWAEGGGYAVAKTEYVGGFEGASEYWWMRIRDGVREQVRDCMAVDPLKPISYDINELDPRVYHLTNGAIYLYRYV